MGGREFPAAAPGTRRAPDDAPERPPSVPAEALRRGEDPGSLTPPDAATPPEPAVAPSGSGSPLPTAARPADRSGAEGLGRIRRAVHQLAARVSSPDGGRSQPPEPRPAVPEPPIPEPAVPEPAAVVVAGPPPPPETPAAFWERSYLGQFLLRTVR